MSRNRAQPHNVAAAHKEQDSEFISIIHSLARYQPARDIFGDFCELAYCAVAKRTLPPGQKADALEARYMRTISGDNYAKEMPKLLAIMTLALAKDCRDFLGPIAAGVDALNVRAGQFFTPPEVSEMMARMMLTDFKERIADKGYFTLADPAVGSGSMMLASAKVVSESGYDPAQVLYIEGTDIAPVCFKMAYLQFAMTGLNARVVCGDSLAGTELETALTPAAILSMSRSGARETHRAAIDAAAQTPAPPRLTKFARGVQDAPRISAQPQRVRRSRDSLMVGTAHPALLTQGRFSNREELK